jgi:hypothetical protein
MGPRANHPTSALAALTATEKAAVFDELLALRPDLRELAETHAARLLSSADRGEVADAVEHAMLGKDFTELGGRAGYQPGYGYVHPVEAAEAMQAAVPPELDGFDDLHLRGHGRSRPGQCRHGSLHRIPAPDDRGPMNSPPVMKFRRAQPVRSQSGGPGPVGARPAPWCPRRRRCAATAGRPAPPPGR